MPSFRDRGLANPSMVSVLSTSGNRVAAEPHKQSEKDLWWRVVARY